jgi:hypothetical protein
MPAQLLPAFPHPSKLPPHDNGGGKWTAQRNRVAALAARLPGAGTVLRIEGGLPRISRRPNRNRQATS